MYLLDTNILIYSATREYQSSDISRKYLHLYKAIPANQKIILEEVLVEFNHILFRTIPRVLKLKVREKERINSQCLSLLEFFINNYRIRSASKEDLLFAIDILKQNQSLSLVDALLLAVAKRREFILVSADKEINKLCYKMDINNVDYFKDKTLDSNLTSLVRETLAEYST